MTRLFITFCLALSLAMTGAHAVQSNHQMSAEQARSMPQYINAALAESDYKLKCQGCHRPDGSGDDKSNPPLKDVVSLFLHSAKGREFLVRVPGVSMADLSDKRVANILNWSLWRFDRGNIPNDFKPFTTEEVASLRHDPIRLNRVELRADILSKIEAHHASSD